jgi:hypothetical protein
MSADSSSLYDIAIGGIGFVFANTGQNPMVRETVQPEKQRIDQAVTPGEQTLTNWWIKSQDSFHGGAGQLQLEPAFPTPFDHVRFDQSKNVDVFVPGRVSRLPDTTVIDPTSATQLLGVTVAGADAVVCLNAAGTAKLITNLTTVPSTSSFTNASVATGIKSIATDGTYVFAATATDVFRLDPTSLAAATKLATYPASATTGPVVSWVKSRLMLGVNGAVYELDVTQTAVTLGATQLRYQHPSTGFTWRCFSTAPGAIVAAGDAGGQSTVTQFNLNMVAGAPVLQVQGDIAPLPYGERVLSMANVMGSFLVVGTTKGFRVGTFNTYTGALVYGPLHLAPTAPVIPAGSMAARDRFVYIAGKDFDEAGLIRLDLGTKVDDAGRYAWAPDLICPTFTTSSATAVCTLPVSASLVFAVTGTGILLEGTGAGTIREAWVRTSRIRFGTVEPKLWKLGRIRGDLTSGEIQATAFTPFKSAVVGLVGFTVTDPDEFRLIEGKSEWLQLKLQLLGQTSMLTSYQVKALSGTRRQRHMQFEVSIADAETTKSGQRVRATLSSRDRLAQLEALDADGDEVTLQEFTPTGVISTRVVIEQLSFRQIGRPTRRSDIGGNVTVLLRTVES